MIKSGHTCLASDETRDSRLHPRTGLAGTGRPKDRCLGRANGQAGDASATAGLVSVHLLGTTIERRWIRAHLALMFPCLPGQSG